MRASGTALEREEVERLARLADYDIVGSGPERAYDAIVALTAELFAMPMSLIALVGEDSLWIKAAHGVPVNSVPRDLAFCSHTIEQPDPMIVADVSRDPRFAGNPLVIKDGVRFYAGAAVQGYDGVRLGTICVLDTVPHPEFGDRQRRLLEHLAEIVSERLEHRRLDRVARTASSFAETSRLAMLTTDKQGMILFWNRAAEQMFGWKREEAVGRNVTLIVPDRFRVAHARGMARAPAGGPTGEQGKSLELIAVRADGSEFPIQLSLSMWDGSHGAGFGAQIEDISARRERQAALEHLAEHDELTGLNNRGSFRELLARSIAEHGCACVFAIDLDGFKSINDALGHAVGDAFLQALAARLQIFAQDEGILARLGGDEFALLVPGSDDIVRAGDLATRLCRAIREITPVAGHLFQVGASIGIAVAPLHGLDADELLVRADLAMFRSKRDAPGSYRVFDPGMARELSALRAFKQEICHATARGEWELHYQPQVDLADGRTVGVEALLRWRHPTRGLLAPAAFVDVLDTHADAYKVGMWALDHACGTFAGWRAAGASIERVSVNLFAAQLRTGGLHSVVMDVVARHRLRPEQLELELTESIALRQDDLEREEIARLHAQGVGISFDDFGTGFASLSTLKRFPLTRLKIDRSFVQDICSEPHSGAIVEGIIAIAHRLGLKVIAEGIETELQHAALVRLGCDEAQGFRFGKPMTDADILALLTGKHAAPIRPAAWRPAGKRSRPR